MQVRQFFEVWGGKSLLQRLAVSEGPVCLFAAVSGGADSVLLLHALAILQREYGSERIKLAVCHVSHGIRGVEGERDAAFVESLAADYGLPFFIKQVDAPALANEQKRGMEAAARVLRYRAFAEVLTEQGFQPAHGRPSVQSLHTSEWLDETGCKGYVILAHHGGDQAESMLLNIQRGSGLNGLTGMERSAGALRRPWLDLPSKQIPVVIEAEQLPFIADSTNEDRVYARNRVRLDLMPLWDKIAGHSVEQKLIELSSRLAKDEALLQRTAADELHDAECGRWVVHLNQGYIMLSMFHAKGLTSPEEEKHADIMSVPVWSAERVSRADQALIGRILALAADISGGTAYDLEARHYDLIHTWLSSETAGTLDLPAGQKLYRSGDEFIFMSELMIRLLKAVSLIEVHYAIRQRAVDGNSHQPPLRLLTFGKVNDETADSVVGGTHMSYNDLYVRKPKRIDIGTLSNYRTRRKGDTIPASVLQCQDSMNDSLSSSAKRVGLKRLWQRYRIPEFLRDRVIFKVNASNEIIGPAVIEDIEQTLMSE